MKTHLHIFKAGAHTAMSGQSLSFTDADLSACAAAYDPKKHEAPIVLSTPTSEKFMPVHPHIFKHFTQKVAISTIC